MIEILAYRLLSDPTLHDAMAKHRFRLRWAAAHSGETMWNVIDTAILYDEKFGKLPGVKALWEFCETSPDPAISRRAELIRGDLKSLQSVDKELLAQFTDIDVLIDLAVVEARKAYHVFIYQKAVRLVNQGRSSASNAAKKQEPSGPDEAWAWVQKMHSHDLNEDGQVGGVWQENMPTVEKRLDDYLSADASDRILTKFKKIDDSWVISHKYERCLGILGSTGEGKTLFLKSLVYNFAKQGKNVLYVTLEVDVETMWEHLAFIYAGVEHENEFQLPALQKWIHHKTTNQIKPEDRANMQKAIDAIKRREKVPGLIDVQRLYTWDSIVEYLNAHHTKNQYDVLVIDYIERLHLPADVKEQFRNDYYNAVCRNAFNLSRSFDKNRGLIVISPAQPTKDGHKKAGEDEAGEYSLDDLSYLSNMRMDWDVVMSVYSSDDDKFQWQMRVKCLKQGRSSSMFGAHILKVDSNSLYVHDLTFKAEKFIHADIDGAHIREVISKDLEFPF